MKIFKTCKKHGELKEQDIKSGIYRGKHYKKCRHCEVDRSRKYYTKKYQDPNFVKQKHAKDKKRWNEKKEEIKEKRKLTNDPAKRKAAYQKNADQYRENYRNKQKEYRETLHDSYIKRLIHNDNKQTPMRTIPQSMIDLKKSLMLLKKSVKNKTIGDKKLNENKKY